MAANSKIQWTDATWNPTVGCSVISPGCTNCYAMRHAWRLAHNPKTMTKYEGTVRKVNGKAVWTGKVNLDESALLAPLAWRKPRRVFVDSMSDLFHENVPDLAIDRVSAVMALTPHITYQVLTKRGERMREYCLNAPNLVGIAHEIHCAHLGVDASRNSAVGVGTLPTMWPLPNVWKGVSVEDQRRADERVQALLDTPATVRFLSCEPLLGPVDLSPFLPGYDSLAGEHVDTGLHWVIVGGESGPDARPFDLAWARSLRDQCQAAGVAFFMKQLGSRPVDGAREYPCADGHGGDPDEWPADLRVQAFPCAPGWKAGGHGCTRMDGIRVREHGQSIQRSSPSIRVNPTPEAPES